MILPFNRILIHCSAGLGRSGVVAAILMVMFGWGEQGRQLSVFEQVRRLRERRFGALQN
jgi:protein-tyrosine phosphatase